MGQVICHVGMCSGNDVYSAVPFVMLILAADFGSRFFGTGNWGIEDDKSTRKLVTLSLFKGRHLSFYQQELLELIDSS
jgi:hypothetical protein